MTVLHLDFETFSRQDIKKVGGHKYAADPSTEVLMASYAIDTGEVLLWDATENPIPPGDLYLALTNPETVIHAFNATFERLILKFVMGLDIPVERFHCTMIHAWSLGFSGGLGAVGEQMGLSPDKKKIAEGKKLINRFCKPAPRNHKADRYTKETHPEEWARFCEYCVQDTISEREMEMLLAPYPLIQPEKDLWYLDQRVNDRGLPIDTSLVHGAVKIRNAEIAKLKQKMNEVTGLSNANSPVQLQAWVQGKGVPMADMTKETVESTLALPVLPGAVREVLELRQQASKTSVKKWDALHRATGDDGFLRSCFQFGGAQRTARWAGRFFQPQNLPRPSRKDIDVIAGLLSTGDRDLVEMIYGDVMLFLSDTIRAAVTAPEGLLLGVSDLGSIESRVLGWESGCFRINDIFARGLDTYRDFAQELFNVTYDEVTKEQRSFSKPPVLGCLAGYTAVLTETRGWTPLVSITKDDRVWDGVEFVKHCGVVSKGVKPVLTHKGISATPDHLFLVDGVWVEWGSITPDGAEPGLVHTYDILNCGPRHQFMVGSFEGDMIAHNCGYRLGAEGLKKYAESMGVQMTIQEAEHAVKLYRDSYPEVVQMWYWLDEALMDVIDGGGVREGYAVQVSRDDNFLFIELASGRKIAYFKPLILAKTPPWGGGTRPTITYMGMNQYNRKWERLTSHGGKATEQITQATARDILGYQMKIVENERPDMILVGHVHDEMLTLMGADLSADLILELEEIMSTTPPWAPGLLLGAEGFVTKRYKKD